MTDAVSDSGGRGLRRGEQAAPERGWLHAHTVTGMFGPRQLDRLATAPIGTVVWLSAEQDREIYPPAASSDSNSAAAGFDAVEGEWLFEESPDDAGVLLHVERVYREAAGGDYRIVGRHHPRDAYAAPGTPLREALDLVEGGAVDVCELAAARLVLLDAAGDWSFDRHRREIRCGGAGGRRSQHLLPGLMSARRGISGGGCARFDRSG